MKKRLLLSPLASILILTGLAQAQTPDSSVNIKSLRAIQKLQIELVRQQAELQKAVQVQQVYSNLVKDMVSLTFNSSGKLINEKLQKLLAQNGINATSDSKDHVTVAPKPDYVPKVDAPLVDDPAKFVPAEPLTGEMKTDYDYLEGTREANFKLMQKAQVQQAYLQKLVTDLLELAKTDKDAKAIVDKYNISQQAPPK